LADSLSAFRADEFDLVVCTTAPSPRAHQAKDIAEAAKALGCDDVVVASTVEVACDRALNDAGPDDAILVAGSLYVVGAARPYLKRILP
jgi:folylpolyglutamate synthase/dihydropteroate synthase